MASTKYHNKLALPPGVMAYIHAVHLSDELNEPVPKPSDETLNFIREGDNYKKFLGNEWRERAFREAVDRKFIEQKLEEQTSDDEEDKRGYIIVEKHRLSLSQSAPIVPGYTAQEIEAAQGLIKLFQSGASSSSSHQSQLQSQIADLEAQDFTEQIKHGAALPPVGSHNFIARRIQGSEIAEQSEGANQAWEGSSIPGGNGKQPETLPTLVPANVEVVIETRVPTRRTPRKDKKTSTMEIEPRPSLKRKAKRRAEEELDRYGDDDEEDELSMKDLDGDVSMNGSAIGRIPAPYRSQRRKRRKVSNESVIELHSKLSKSPTKTVVLSFPAHQAAKLQTRKEILPRHSIGEKQPDIAIAPGDDSGEEDEEEEEQQEDENEAEEDNIKPKQRPAYSGRSKRKVEGPLLNDQKAFKYALPKNESTDPADKPWELLQDPKPLVRKSAARRCLDVDEQDVQQAMLTLKFRHKQDPRTILTYTYDAPRDWDSQREITALIKKIGQDRRRESGTTKKPRPGYKDEEIEWLVKHFEDHPEARGNEGMSVADWKALAATYNELFRKRQARIASKHNTIEVGPRSWHGIMSLCDRNARIIAARRLSADAEKEEQLHLHDGGGEENGFQPKEDVPAAPKRRRGRPVKAKSGQT